MGITKIVNKTHCFLEVREGNAGVYSSVGEIRPGESLTFSINENATYREFWIRTLPDGVILTLTSDDMVEFGVITIIGQDENIQWEPTEKRTYSGRPPLSRLSRFLEWLLRRN